MKKQFVKILKEGKYNNIIYKKGETYEVIDWQEGIARISNKALVSTSDHTVYGKEAELINNFQNKYELWD